MENLFKIKSKCKREKRGNEHIIAAFISMGFNFRHNNYNGVRIFPTQPSRLAAIPRGIFVILSLHTLKFSQEHQLNGKARRTLVIC